MKPGRETEAFGSSQGLFSIWQGIDFPTWMRLLTLQPALSWSKAPRLAAVTVSSVANSVLGALEHAVYGRQVAQTDLVAPPVFILGHWRSGTTLLHNLLSQDPRFTYLTLYEIINPHHFLLTEGLVTKFTSWLVPKTRPMDNMALTWDAPQEDETALCNLTLNSPYLMLACQGDREKYGRFFDFQDASPQELARWKQAFHSLLKRVTYKDPRTLLLKSPPHTYRIPLLLEMFPGAQFIYIVRNPYNVYSSSMHLRTRLFEANGLGKPNLKGLEDDIFLTYEHLMERYEADRGMIPAHNLHELKYEDLERDPLGELRAIYRNLGWEGFSTLEAKVRPQLGELQEYKKNRFAEMDDELRRKIYRHWHGTFERHDYPTLLEAPVQPAQAQVA